MAELVLTNVTLHYPVQSVGRLGPGNDPREMGGIVRRMTSRRVEVTALQSISLTARDGDRIALIGHNGAGKTTMLRVAAGTVKPTEGMIRRIGKTNAVLNPSVGLDPNLSGYENIEQIGFLSGLDRRGLNTLVPDVAEFTELGDFLTLPVQTYSAGMKTRLAFGVATAMKPDILITDESIETGDAAFIQKARLRMQAMMQNASILLLATHSMATVKDLCNRAILLRHGEILADGDVDEVISKYHDPNT